MFDILQTQGDAGVRAFGQQFGLSPEQTRRAMEALLPALAIGLQHNSAVDPMGFGRLFGFGGATAGAPPPPAQLDLLPSLFGSPMLSQAVIQQAAAVSGVGTQALRQMLPIMAGMIVAGVVHMLLNQQPAAPAAEPPAPLPLPMGNLWTDWLSGLTAAASAKPAPPAPPRRERLADPPREASPSPDAAKASLEVLSQMFQTGAEVQEQNVKAMREVFDAFWSPPKTEAGKAESGKAEAKAAEPAPNAATPPAQPLASPRKRPGAKG